MQNHITLRLFVHDPFDHIKPSIKIALPLDIMIEWIIENFLRAAENEANEKKT